MFITTKFAKIYTRTNIHGLSTLVLPPVLGSPASGVALTVGLSEVSVAPCKPYTAPEGGGGNGKHLQCCSSDLSFPF